MMSKFLRHSWKVSAAPLLGTTALHSENSFATICFCLKRNGTDYCCSLFFFCCWKKYLFSFIECITIMWFIRLHVQY
jgi:hypothetical protein